MIVSNVIRIEFDELNKREWERLFRRLTFATPEGQVVQNFNRFMTKGYVKIPRGAWYLVDHLDYKDRRVKPPMPSLFFNVKLNDTEKDPRYEGQLEAVEAMLENEQGQIIRAPGTGKTQIALAFIAKARTRTLVLVHTEDILQQWVEYAQRAIPGIDVGVIRGKEYRIGHLTIATIQTAHKYAHDTEFQKAFGAVIADEGHHVAAETWQAVLNHSRAFYRFLFTASPTRADGMHPMMTQTVGPVIHKQKFSSPVNLKVIPVKTNFKFRYRGRWDWARLLNALISDDHRNRMIARRVDREIERGNSVLVLSRRIEHLERIAAAMSSDSEILTAGRGKGARKEILRSFRSGECRAVLATQLADEALDVPRLNRVFLVHPGKHEGRIIQQIGRAIRQHPDKTDARIYDFVDDKISVLNRQWKQRRRTYKQNNISIRKRKLNQVLRRREAA